MRRILLVMCICYSVSEEKPARTAREADGQEVGVLSFKMLQLESRLVREQTKIARIERQLSEVRQHLTSLGGFSHTLSVPKVTKPPQDTSPLKRIRADIDSIKTCLGQEKQRTARLEELTEKLKHRLETQESGADVNGLYNTTEWLADKITALEEQCLAVTNSSDNSESILERREMANRIGVHFNGEPLNSRSFEVFRDCAALYRDGYRENGVYTVLLSDNNLRPVWCDFEYSDDDSRKGWMVVQRRFSGELDFNRTWEEYKQGFGDLSSEFWLGNECIWSVVNSSGFRLSVKILLGGNQASSFSMSGKATNHFCSEAEDYQLFYHQVAYAPFTSSQYPLSGSSFMTWDKQQIRPGCPPLDGGWWYSERNCSIRTTNPNSAYKVNRSPTDGELYRGYLNIFSYDDFWDRVRLRLVIIGSEVLIYV